MIRLLPNTRAKKMLHFYRGAYLRGQSAHRRRYRNLMNELHVPLIVTVGFYHSFYCEVTDCLIDTFSYCPLFKLFLKVTIHLR